MYAECSKRVAEKRMQNPSKDTTVILNELLADEVWLSQVSEFLIVFLGACAHAQTRIGRQEPCARVSISNLSSI